MKSKSALFLVALSLSGLLTGCHKTAVNQVRTGYMEFNKTTALGQAIDHTFQNGKWTSFTTEKGVTIVEFDGTAPFSKFTSGLELSCSANATCIAAVKKAAEYCDSLAGQAPFQNIEEQKATLKTQLAELQHEDNVMYSQGEHGQNYTDLNKKEMDVQQQILQLGTPESACINHVYTQNANVGTPVTIQFTVNHDGTFQYEADNVSRTNEQLFTFIYK
ncbi:MAG: hypothetical protein WCF54_07455 [Terracidiphilus sp.]